MTDFTHLANKIYDLETLADKMQKCVDRIDMGNEKRDEFLERSVALIESQGKTIAELIDSVEKIVDILIAKDILPGRNSVDSTNDM